jgi:L-ascorbate metabolism protein UlaG (beta-lactamase superfamily)
MKIIYHGHSFVQLEIPEHSILIDPFITGNPTAITKVDDLKCDYIILTHGHGDHISDALKLAKKNNAMIIASFEIANFAGAHDVSNHPLGIGGGYNFPFGRVKLTLAHHSSSFPDGSYAGNPAGVLIYMDGKTIYHAGDTGLFYDMKLIGEMNKIDCAFLPIGDNFTMGIDDAVKAAEFINAGITVPIHYNTFDIIKANPEDYKKKVESIGKKCRIINIGDSIEI